MCLIDKGRVYKFKSQVMCNRTEKSPLSSQNSLSFVKIFSGLKARLREWASSSVTIFTQTLVQKRSPTSVMQSSRRAQHSGFCENRIVKMSSTFFIFFLRLFTVLVFAESSAWAENKSEVVSGTSTASAKSEPQTLSLRQRLEEKVRQTPEHRKASLVFDLPVSYNRRVSFWINHFQIKGRSWFGEWLERSSKYLPFIQRELKNMGLPQDLAFMVMVESGFSHNARSSAEAVGPWQFIQATGQRYGLKTNWWLDERRDLQKSTQAAIRYIRDLYKDFGSWYLVAASYNMGENGLRKQVKKFKTKDFWSLSRQGALPVETMDYVPKILAAMLISKSPGLYGFTDYAHLAPLEYEVVIAPGGTELNGLADHIGVTRQSLKDLNAELILGYIPRQVEKHAIRIPRGAMLRVTDYIEQLTKPSKVSSAKKTNNTPQLAMETGTETAKDPLKTVH